MARFTKALRQQIVEDFARQNNGWFDPKAFVAHVRKAGADHPAFEWFTWDDEAAAEAHRLDQARDFARGLVVKFEVEEIRPRGKVTVVAREAPFAVSPQSTRKSGGGYYLTDPTDADHQAELRRQAATDLGWFLRRYASVIPAKDAERLEGLRATLEGPKEAAA